MSRRPRGRQRDFKAPRRGARSSRPEGKKRPFSDAHAGGAISVVGEPEPAKALADALAAARKQSELATSLTHAVHSYPARMHPATARALVELVKGEGGASVLDPFCGSGTTLVEARRAGIRAVGVDANPLAVRIARAKIWTATKREREQLRQRGHKIAGRALAESKAARRSGYEAPEQRERKRGDELLGPAFLRHTRRELEFLYSSIMRLSPVWAELLLVPLSSILHKVSLRASDTDPTLVTRRVGRGSPSRLFAERVDQLVDGLDELARSGRGPAPQVILGDARELPDLEVQAVITSPPYLGTYDYSAHHDLRLAFFELDDRIFERREIGARRKGGQKAALARWRADTRAWLEACAKVLPDGGLLAAVVGDSVLSRTAVYADRELKRGAPKGLTFIAQASQTRAKRGSRDRDAFADSAKREHVLLFRRGDAT